MQVSGSDFSCIKKEKHSISFWGFFGSVYMRSPVSFRLFTSLSQNLFVPSPHFSLRLHILHMPPCLRHPLCLHLSLSPSINLHLCAALTAESICGPFPDHQSTLFHVLWLVFKSLGARLNSLHAKLGGGSRSG